MLHLPDFFKCRAQQSVELRVQNAELKDKIVGEGFSLPQINDKEKRADMESAPTEKYQHTFVGTGVLDCPF